MPNWKKLIVSGSDATLNSLNVINGITGSLYGTASWAENSITSSYSNYAETASYAINIVVSGSINDVDYIDFDTTVPYTTVEGRLGWDSGEGTLQLGLEGGNVTYSLGEQVIQYVYNDSGVTLTKGQVVYISGAQGNRIAVKLASNVGDPSSAGTLGLVAETIAIGGNGWIVSEGNLRKLNTLGLTPGALLYLGETPGTYTQTKPVAPKHEVRIGYVERVHASVGSIYVKVDNGYEIGELHDVVDTSTTGSYGDLLVKSGSVWINSKQLTGSYGITGSLQVTGNIVGTLIGSASYANQALSSSFATTASYATYALFAANGGGGGSIDTGSLLITGSVVGNVLTFTKGNSTTFTLTVATGSGGGGGGGAAVTHTQAAAANTWTFNHNLNTLTPLLQVYDLNYEQIIPNEVVSISAFTSEIRFDYTQAGYAVASTGGGLIITGSTAKLIQTAPATTWSFAHNLGSKYPAFEVFNENDDVVIPAGIHVVDENNAEIYFAIPSTGIAIANFSGIDGLIPSASYSATSSYSDQFNIGETQTRYATVASSISGSNIVFTQSTGSYTSAFFKYTVGKTTNARSGEIMAVWNGSTVAFTDNSTTDIGSTSGVTPTVTLSGANVRLNMNTSTSGWRVKSIATFM